MTRKFICVQGSPEIPKGAIAHYVETQNKYFVWQHEPLFIGNTPVGSVPVEYSASFLPWQIEGNPCWEEVKEEPTGKWRPELDGTYYYISHYGEVSNYIFHNDECDKQLLNAGNVYRTKEEAEDEVKRRESIAKAWWPDESFDFYLWDFLCKEAVRGGDKDSFTSYAYIGACHKTKEACEEWGKEYSHLFDKRPKHD